MRAGFPLILITILSIFLIIDLYAFRGIRLLTTNFQPWIRLIINLLYWIIPIIIIILAVYITLHFRESVTTKSYRTLYFMIGLMIAIYIPKLVFIVFQFSSDFLQIIGMVLNRFVQSGKIVSDIAIYLSHFTILLKIGIVVAVIPFLAIIHGIAWGRFNYKVKNIRLESDVLPPSFNRFKVLQISDWHIGSFVGRETKVQKSVDLINSQNADLVVFTGDFVNNVAGELESFIPILKQIKAPYGVYSILGNHDYGEYISWKSEADHHENMTQLYQFEKEAGFHLLRNESVIIRKGNDSIGLAGVENWGMHPFPQYGKLLKALENIKSIPYKIMLSHDPSHWDAEIVHKTDVDLTLSGHTHGLQFGINLPGFKWSPVKWKYPRWYGLHQDGDQYLYVNVGIGYIAFPGRVGFMPEIAVFELSNQRDKR